VVVEVVEETAIIMLDLVDLVVAHRVQDLIPLLVVVVMKEVILHQKEMLVVVHSTRVTDMEEVAAVVPVALVETRDLMVFLVLAEMVFAFLQHSEIQITL
tara:strand:+ start:172 stop:471 length:300 start_codon:yes stop_codon:yes gene_type:complete